MQTCLKVEQFKGTVYVFLLNQFSYLFHYLSEIHLRLPIRSQRPYEVSIDRTDCLVQSLTLTKAAPGFIKNKSGQRDARHPLSSEKWPVNGGDR